MGDLNLSGEEEGFWESVCRSAPSDRVERIAEAAEGEELGEYASSAVAAVSALGCSGVLLAPLPLPPSSGLLMSGEWNGFLRVTLAASTRRRLAAGVDILQSRIKATSCYAV